MGHRGAEHLNRFQTASQSLSIQTKTEGKINTTSYIKQLLFKLLKD